MKLMQILKESQSSKIPDSNDLRYLQNVVDSYEYNKKPMMITGKEILIYKKISQKTDLCVVYKYPSYSSVGLSDAGKQYFKLA